MSKDKYINELIKLQTTSNKFMGEISHGIKAINDTNKLHREAIDANTIATQQMVISNASVLSLLRWLLVVLVLAIVVLAGAEKVLKFLPQP